MHAGNDYGKLVGASGKAQAQHKDKLAQTKAAEREQREAHRAELARRAAAAAAAKSASAAAVREERALHDTRRAAKDARAAAKREKHAATGQECEHGVWRCRVCFPHAGPRDHHHAKRAAVDTAA